MSNKSRKIIWNHKKILNNSKRKQKDRENNRQNKQKSNGQMADSNLPILSHMPNRRQSIPYWTIKQN